MLQSMSFVPGCRGQLCHNHLMMDRYNLNPSQIVMYATQRCPDCARVKAYFEMHHIPYQLVLLEEDERATQFVTKLNRGCNSVPTLIFPDGSILVEPSWEELKAKFN